MRLKRTLAALAHFAGVWDAARSQGRAMTAAPIDIPLDERGAPDLQLLVRKLGEAAAKERGEA